MKKVKGIILRPGEKFKEIEIEDSLDGMYKAIGCEIIEVPVIGITKNKEEWQMILDEEGKINGKQVPNDSLAAFGIAGDVAWGPMLFLGITGDGGNCSITEDMKEDIYSRLPHRVAGSFSVQNFE